MTRADQIMVEEMLIVLTWLPLLWAGAATLPWSSLGEARLGSSLLRCLALLLMELSSSAGEHKSIFCP